MKKIWTLLCVVLCIFGMTACGGAKTEEALPEEYQSLQSTMESRLQSILALSDDEVKSQLNETEADGWLDVKPHLGDYIGTKDFSYTIDGDTVTAILQADFSEHDLTMTVVIDTTTGYADSISYARDLSIGEIFSKAALNTLIGMCVVFAVLIFISFLISCFKYIPDFSKKKEAPAAAPAAAPAPAVVEEEEEDLSDDLELVAVITAAIAASEGTSTDGFVVRSIKRAPGAKWKRA